MAAYIPDDGRAVKSLSSLTFRFLANDRPPRPRRGCGEFDGFGGNNARAQSGRRREHLAGDEVDEILERVAEVLKPGGRLVLIQPNHRLCAENYFDDPTHLTVFDDSNIGDWLARSGLQPVEVVPGLLTFSMNGRLPKSGILTRLYLMSPWKPLAAQMYVAAEKN